MSEAPVVPSTTPITSKSRPVLVWAVLLYYSLVTMVWLFQVGSTLTRPPEGRLDSHGEPYTLLDYAESFAFVVLKLSAAVLLFRLKRAAVKVLLAALALNLVATSYDLATRGLPPPGGGAMIFPLFLGLMVYGGVCWYAWRLDRRGVLS